jgi:hypothetical protein
MLSNHAASCGAMTQIKSKIPVGFSQLLTMAALQVLDGLGSWIFGSSWSAYGYERS